MIAVHRDGPEQQRRRMVDSFEQIRDLPYHISIAGEQDFSCVTKSQLLHEALKEIGVQSRFVTCSFYWSRLDLPRELMKLPHDGLAYHQFLEVQVPESGTWVDVDPTWDSKLARILPVAHWDGKSSTTCAVPILRRWYEDEKEYLVDARENCFDRKTARFMEAFNSFLASARR